MRTLKRAFTTASVTAIALALAPVNTAQAAALAFSTGVGPSGKFSGSTTTCSEQVTSAIGLGDCKVSWALPPAHPEGPQGICGLPGVVRATGTYVSYTLGTTIADIALTGEAGGQVGFLTGTVLTQDGVLVMEINAAAFCGVGGLDGGTFTSRVKYFELDV